MRRGGVAYLMLGYKRVYPLFVPNLSPNLGYIRYREGNLIVIEKCYGWQNCRETDVENGKYVPTLMCGRTELCIGEN